MKTPHLFLLVFTCLIYFGCSHHSDDFPGRMCQFYIHFVDKEGKDLSVDLKMKDAYEILRTEYNLKTYWNGELIKPDNNIMYTHFTKESNPPSYLFFAIQTSQPQFNENVIEFHLICPRIFGNDEKHILSAIWNIQPKEEGSMEVLESLTYEGKNIPATMVNHTALYKITVE